MKGRDGTYCLGGRERPRPNLPLRRSAGMCRYPRVTAGTPGWLPHRARNGHMVVGLTGLAADPGLASMSSDLTFRSPNPTTPSTVNCRRWLLRCRRTGMTQWEGVAVADVVLREIEDGDLDRLFEQMRDAESVRMAAFVSRDPNDREAFDAHMARVRSAPGTRNRAITRDGHLVGSIASFVIEGDTEITYWIDRSVWGQGLASTALTLFLQEQQIRPLHARRPAITPRRSGFCRRQASASPAPRSPTRTHEVPRSRKPSPPRLEFAAGPCVPYGGLRLPFAISARPCSQPYCGRHRQHSFT
jgi:Acetyltransferase (GNAT) domain